MSTSSADKRKVARIVFDRPPLKKLNFILFTIAGLALGLLIALFLSWLGYGPGDDAGTEVPAAMVMRECVRWYLPLGLVGLVAGLGFGWGWGRSVTARIETVEHQPMARRRSSSTALVRVDYGRRW